MRTSFCLFAAGLIVLALAGCSEPRARSAAAPTAMPQSANALSPQPAPGVDPLRAIVAGTGALDREIIRLQTALREGRADTATWERLGWSFIFKARASFDEQFYALAEECSRRIEQLQPGAAEARLLLGHIRHSTHRFAEAEALARALVRERGLHADFGLLGDALMEQGRLKEAAAAYQRMIDLRPDLQSYYRVAHLRWLKGNLEGAIEVCGMAARTAGSHDAESAAWIHARLAAFQFQAGEFASAQRNCAAALAWQSNYPPALLLEGRLRLANEDAAGALASLEEAARQNPLPEYQWALSDALRLAGHITRANAVEDDLQRHGAASDPRTFALFLATRGRQGDTAVRLASAELRTRADVFTHDAAAWALLRAGRVEEADQQMRLALAEGTQNARLFLHAAAIASHNGHATDADRWLARLDERLHELLPSEQEHAERLRHLRGAVKTLSSAAAR